MRSGRQVEAAVEEFNKYRSPEAVAEIVGISGDNIKIKFRGPFCTSCGVEDYFDDLRLELEKNTSDKIEITKIEGGAETGAYVVTFRKISK